MSDESVRLADPDEGTGQHADVSGACTDSSSISGRSWPEVLTTLLAGTTELPGGDPALYLRPHHLLPTVHRLLAGCALRAGPQGCVAAVGDEALGRWLYDTSKFVWRGVGPAAHPGRFPRFTGWMRVDPLLPSGLCLLGLASDHAQRVQTPLIVVAVEPCSFLGRCTRREVTIGAQRRTATLIELAQPTLDTWAHELAHAVDPVLGDRDPTAAEAFADTLGPALLADHPRGLADLDALITRAETLIAPADQDPKVRTTVRTSASVPAGAAEHYLPEPGVPSLAAFLALDLRGWRP